MKFTLTKRLLVYGLEKTPLEKNDRVLITMALKTQEQQAKMVAYLKTHENASAQEILNEFGRLITVTP